MATSSELDRKLQPDRVLKLGLFGAAVERIAELEFEVMVLRMYGNKDCTAMADEQIAKKRAGEKCDFED